MVCIMQLMGDDLKLTMAERRPEKRGYKRNSSHVLCFVESCYELSKFLVAHSKLILGDAL